MKAAVVTGPGRTPEYRDFDDPLAADGLAVVHVAASALSTATRARAAGTHYSETHAFPLVPGIDGVGRTEDGRRVGFLLPEAPFGGMAERTLVRAAVLVPVPDGLDDVTAAAVLNPGQSPIGALRVRAELQAGETVLVNGATGITGQVAVQLARHLGAGRIVATGRDAGALARLAELGADATVDLTGGPDAVRDAVAGLVRDGGVDVVLDYLSGPPTEAVLAALAGSPSAVRYVIAGGSAAQSTAVPTSVLGSTRIAIMGAGIGAVRPPEIVAATAEALRTAADVGLRIDVRAVPLKDVAAAWGDRADRNRLVLTV